MRYDELVDFYFEMWASKGHISQMLLGPPGTGKSSIAVSLSEKITRAVQGNNPSAPPAICSILDLSTKNKEDIVGLPSLKDGLSSFFPFGWLNEITDPDAYGVLCLDDLPSASQSVQVASRQLILERRVDDRLISDGILIMVTGNRREDKCAALTLASNFRNSVCSLSLDLDFDLWADWYGKEIALAPVIPSFLRYRPSHFSTLPKQADDRGQFATPRTWAMLGKCLAVAQKQGILTDVASGLVGAGPATELCAFINVKSQLVDPAQVLKDPKMAMPDPVTCLERPDKAYAMTTGLGEVAAAWMTDPGKKRKDTALKFMQAVGWVTQSNREYIATAVSTFTGNQGEIKDLVKAATTNPDDELVKGVIDFLADCFNTGGEK